MRRRTFLAGLLAVPVAVACEPVRGVSLVSPGNPGSGDVSDLTGAASVNLGEDWHYVGDTGEPAFVDGWSNVGTPWPALAFRLRESGIVDVVGVVTTDGSSEVIATLPEGYRPLGSRYVPLSFVRSRSGTMSARVADISQAGTLTATGADAAGDVVYLSGVYFLGNATAP